MGNVIFSDAKCRIWDMCGDDTAAAITILDRVISYWSLIVVGLPLYILHLRRDVAATVSETLTPG
jgi:hypothetical protein